VSELQRHSRRTALLRHELENARAAFDVAQQRMGALAERV